MTDGTRMTRTRRRALGALVAFGCATLTTPAGPSIADVPGVGGEAYGQYTNVGLFGGPQRAIGPAPMVTLPPNGSATPITASDPDGASAVYGPAHIFGGRWPITAAVAPPSGPMTVSTRGTRGPDASVTSTAQIGLFPDPIPVQCDGEPQGTTNCTAPGGFGPTVPIEGDELHSTCSATEAGATGSARFVNAVLATSTDETGEPKDTEPVPEYPPPNYTRTGSISNVGDNWRIVFNEQTVEPDGSITVNALHSYFLGAIAVGEQILGHVRCSLNAQAASDTASPPPSDPAASAPAPAAGAVKPDTGNDVLPLALAGLALAIGVATIVVWARRRPAP